jgi:pyrroloquinoline quinone (PQQ) biosynthesis protein C
MITTQESQDFRSRLDRATKSANEQLQWTRLPDSELTVDAARNYVRQFGLFTRHSRQCWANVVGNCPFLEVRRFIVAENLWEEEANEETSHYRLMVKMGKAIGMDEAEIDDAVPTYPTSVAFLAWESLTKSRPWIEGLAAKSVLERLNNKSLGDLSAVEAERWTRSLGISESDVEFFTLHAVVDQVHGDGTVEIIEQHARNADDLEAALRAAEQSLGVWKIFYDGIVSVTSA